jgi:hypothetical protein
MGVGAQLQAGGDVKLLLTSAQHQAIKSVCYLPEETIRGGAALLVGPWSIKLTVNAGFE